MTLGVFIHRTDSIYDDSPAERYQFPAQYLGRAQACVGDWVLFYEPVKVKETRGYFAVARVREIIPDPAVQAMFVAVIEPGSYLEFANSVPFSGNNGLVEQGLLNEQQRISGRAQSAVRPISPSDFNRIIDLGLRDDEALLPRTDQAAVPSSLHGERAPFVFEQERQRNRHTRRGSSAIACSGRSSCAPMESGARLLGSESSTVAAGPRRRRHTSARSRRMVRTSLPTAWRFQARSIGCLIVG